MIQEKKAAIFAAKADGNIEKEDLTGNDLLTLLIRANLASNMPDSMRMSDEEILSQVPTFLIAGMSSYWIHTMLDHELNERA